MTAADCAASVDLLARLVRIPSVNENTVQADRDQAEAAMAGAVTAELEQLGMVVDRQEIRPGRPNLVAAWPLASARPPLTLEAHLDTVSVAGMTVPPFGAEVREGRLYGRGACDTKGSIAAFLTALRLARRAGWQFDRAIQFVATMGEETACEGSIPLSRSGVDLGWVVVGEPTSCQVVTAHKACFRFQVTCSGIACHGATPEAGRNAIYLMRRVLTHLEEVWLPRLQSASHPLLGSPTANVGLIQGGSAINIVPAGCTVEVDCRLLPGTTADEVLEQLREGLRADLGDECAHVACEPLADLFAGLDLAPEEPLAQRLLAAARAEDCPSEPLGVSYCTDAGPFRTAGYPVVVFGPGDIRVAHSAAEYLPLEDLYRAVRVMLRFLAGFRSRQD